MGQIVWIEELSASQEVISRHRLDDKHITIGRGYDNNLVLDDPYVAPRHLIIVSNGDGTFSVAEQNTINGLFVNESKKRTSATEIKEGDILHIGESHIRLRLTSSPVPAELPLSRLANNNKLFLLLAFFIFPFLSLTSWLEQTKVTPFYTIIISNISVIAFLFVWAAAWSLITRILTGTATFIRNLKISLLLIVSTAVLGELDSFFPFMFNMAILALALKYIMFLTLSGIIYLHLRRHGSTRNKWIAIILALIVIAATSVGYLIQSNEHSISSNSVFVHKIQPPYLRLVPAISSEQFWNGAKQLQSKVDASRTEKPPYDEEDDTGNND